MGANRHMARVRTSEQALSSMQRVWFLLLPGLPVVDVTGAISVLEIANAVLGELRKKPFYRVLVIGAEAGAVRASSGVALAAEPLPARIQGSIAMLIVAAGPWLRTTGHSDAGRAVVESWLARMAPHIGSGATIGQDARTLVQEASRAARAMASARTATAPVHWSAVSVTRGVDLAMSLVAADLGGVIATAISSRMAAPFQRSYGFGLWQPQGRERHRGAARSTHWRAASVDLDEPAQVL